MTQPDRYFKQRRTDTRGVTYGFVFEEHGRWVGEPVWGGAERSFDTEDEAVRYVIRADVPRSQPDLSHIRW